MTHGVFEKKKFTHQVALNPKVMEPQNVILMKESFERNDLITSSCD
jgi:hypothetical protein